MSEPLPQPPIAGPQPRPAGRLYRVRARVRCVPGGAVAWRIGITVAGVTTLIVGVVLLPLPGPGWLIIFAGLGVLATEYQWASRLLARVRRVATIWTRWIARQNVPVRVAAGVAGLLVFAAALAASWYVYIET